MSNRLAVLPLVWLATLPADARAENRIDDRELMQQIVANLNELLDSGKLENIQKAM